MKQPKKLTRTQKEIIRSHGLNEKDYMVQKESDFYLVLKHRTNGTLKRIDNYLIKNGGKR